MICSGGDQGLHQRFMREALDQAAQAARLGEVPVGAVIVRDGQVIAAAHNRRELDNDPTAHAEILAIRAAAQKLGAWRLAGCSLYVTIEPCAMCAGAIVLARLPMLVYGAADPKAGAAGSLMDVTRDPRLNHQVTVVAGVLADECAAVIKGFFAQRRGG